MARDGYLGLGRLCVLGHVGERLGDDEVGHGLHAGRGGPWRIHTQPDRQRGARREAGQGRVQAPVVEHGRMQAADELAHLSKHQYGLIVRISDRLAHGSRALVKRPGPCRGSWPGKFSLGMSQRLGIAAALLGDPATVVLDEPVNGLDVEGIRWIRTLLHDLAAQGKTVFVSSHLMSEIAQTATHLIVIGRGQLIADTTVAEFIASAHPRPCGSAARTSARWPACSARPT